MWKDLELELRALSNNKKIKQSFLGEGNKDSDIIFLFDKLNQDVYENKSILTSEQGIKLKAIIEYSGYDANNYYYTSILKLPVDKNTFIEEEKDLFYDFLLTQIVQINPKFLVVIGENAFDYLIKKYLNTKLQTKELNKLKKKTTDNITDKKVIDIRKCTGNIYDFYGINMVPIYDLEYLSVAKKSEKRKLVEILKQII